MTDPADLVRLERADGVATVTLDRGGAPNALDTALKEALRDTLAEVAADPAVRAVVLTGAGRTFCVGQDLNEHVRELERDRAGAWRTVAEHYNLITTAIATMPKPVVAAVNGVAAGAGASFAFACDLRVVARSAGFNLAFAAIGLTADSGASWTLPRLVGWGRAAELLLLPRTVPAEEALALGLATRVVDDDAVLDTAQELAARLAAGPTLAYAAIRRSLAYAAGHGLEETLAYEAEQQLQVGTSDDHAGAVSAFVRKEKPAFSGR
ncbi:MAG: enoyl-CoA hydratase-related protein [Actinomycetota bacterium]|nr:enoyl-CoA hydratase-related protein [Actinomycetota bacterium]